MRNEKERNDNLILNEETSGTEVLSTSDSKKAATPKLGITIVAMLVLVVIMAVALVGCSKKNNKDNQVTDNSSKVEETVTPNEDTEEPEVEVETEPTEDTKEPEVEVETEPTEDTKEPEVEMVDFETWAKQEGNDEPCLVVWNEELSIQEIIPIFEETMEIYGIKAGDKFAVPYNEKIIAIIVNEESNSFSNGDYLEISLEAGKLNQVAIGFKDEQGETQTKNYLFE